MVFLMAGGGTGGHVMPALAVAQELRRRGHEPFFTGTRTGHEARLVPAAGFPMEWIEIGGLKRVGALRMLRTAAQLPASVAACLRSIRRRRAAAVFSLGGYVAGPPVIAAALLRLPVILMEPNALPGFTNRVVGRLAVRALINFPEAARYFPRGRSELCGVPVREAFFQVPPRPNREPLTVLITGGSRGSRTLNRAVRESLSLWPAPVRLVHQTGAEDYQASAAALAASGLEGRVEPFIADMPAAFAEAALVVCRSGASTVAELCAAGRPSLLVPFPFAADDHQSRNAAALQRAGAARVVPDRELTGERLVREVMALIRAEGLLEHMGRAAKALARPGAASRAADLLEEAGAGR